MTREHYQQHKPPEPKRDLCQSCTSGYSCGLRSSDSKEKCNMFRRKEEVKK